MNHKKAECIGYYGYGNGKEEKEFCSTKCPKNKECWKQTAETVNIQTDEKKFHPYWEARARYDTIYPNSPKKALRLTTAYLARKGNIDPYMERVVKNTKKGFDEVNRDTPQVVRDFSGGVWFYGGSILIHLK
jgi:hypothetical protein